MALLLESHSQPQPIFFFFGSRLPFYTSNHRGRATQTHTKTHAHACTYSRAHTHFACLCSFYSLYRDEKGSVTGCVKNHVTWLGCTVSLRPCCGSPLLYTSPSLNPLTGGEGQENLGTV